jgi:hypothetical protein
MQESVLTERHMRFRTERQPFWGASVLGMKPLTGGAEGTTVNDIDAMKPVTMQFFMVMIVKSRPLFLAASSGSWGFTAWPPWIVEN